MRQQLSLRAMLHGKIQRRMTEAARGWGGKRLRRNKHSSSPGTGLLLQMSWQWKRKALTTVRLRLLKPLL